MLRAVIVVCGTYAEWAHFMKCVRFTKDLLYTPLINNEYNKLTGFKKTTTEVLRIGTWKDVTTNETEKFLALFRVW